MENLSDDRYKERINSLLRFAKSGRCTDIDELTEAEEELYRGVQNLYAAFRQGAISVEEGKARKTQLVNRFWSRRSEENFKKTAAKRYSEMIVRVEGAANAYAKNRTLENADRLYKALYGMEPSKKE
jgi:hypothetical protein